MIEYWKGPYSLNLLFQLQGSVLYASVLPGLLSVLIFTIFRYVYGIKNEKEDLGAPDVVGLLVGGTSLIIVFHTNACYERYWEACGAVHIMMSQWADATVQTACFHMQCVHFNKIKPPSLFHHPDSLNPNMYIDREVEGSNVIVYSPYRIPLSKRNTFSFSIEKEESVRRLSATSITPTPNCLLDNGGRMDGGWGMLYSDDPDSRTSPLYSDVVAKYIDAAEMYSTISDRSSWAREKTPSLFLQELAHLSSLCVAVAFCTLRNEDSDECIAPLRSYKLHQPWPTVNPFDDQKLNHIGVTRTTKITQFFRFFFGINRFIDERKKYCFNRPMYVLGGISKNEIAALRRAKGPSAKTTLVWYWLSEFITREHLAGTLGAVESPIVSRAHQFLSGGMNHYNTARKIMYMPFPFPNEQLSSVVVIPLLILVPVMVSEYTNLHWMGAALTFLTITCLFGLLEAGRELESPCKFISPISFFCHSFLKNQNYGLVQNVPNEVPLCTLLAMYNENIITMCSGFHPDHYWETSCSSTTNSTDSSQNEEQTLDCIENINTGKV